MKFAHLLTMASLLLFLAACDGDKASSLTTKEEVRSYALGASVGQTLKEGEFDDNEKNVEKIVEGFMNSLNADSMGNAEAMEAMSKRFRDNQKPTNEEEGKQIAYYLGYSIIGPMAENVEIPASDFDRAALKWGLESGLNGDSLLISQSDRDSIWRTYMEPKQEEYANYQQMKREEQAKVNIAEGEAFLEANKAKEGVITTESGLQYTVVEAGTGEQPTPADEVKVHYTGTLLNGTVFDSSVERGEPITFPLSGVIPGWTEGVSLMKEGAKYRFFIPQNLAYGMRGAGPTIPAGATLIFDVELLEVNPEKPAMPSAPAQ